MTNNEAPKPAPSPEQPVTGAVNQTAREARELIDKLAALADAATRQSIPAAAQFAHRTVDGAAERAAPVEAWLNRYAEDFNVSQEKILKEARDLIREHPLAAIGIALAAGILIGRITR